MQVVFFREGDYVLGMDAPVRLSMTRDQFLEWEAAQPVRHEFDGVNPVAMAGGTVNHARIQKNLAISVGSRLRGKRCEFFGSNLKIEVAGRIRYPDGFVSCSPAAANERVVTDPVVIFEVLSPSTETTDVVAKNHEYAQTLSVKRYLMLSQYAVGGMMFERIGDDWAGRILTADTVLKMPEIDIDVPLAELYDGVVFEAPEVVG